MVAQAAATVTPAADPAMPPAGDAAQLMQEWALLRERQAGQAQAEEQLAAHRQQLAQAEQQLQEARRELAERSAETLAEAERRGLAMGQEQAGREAEEQLAQRSERINAVLHAMNQSRRTALDEQEDLLVEIVFAAVCRMLGAAAATRAGVESMVRSLVEAAREPAQLCVRLHPHDLAVLTGGGANFDPRLSWQADNAIEIGGCLVDSPRGTLDARLELQLQQLRAALLTVRGAPNKNEVPI